MRKKLWKQINRLHISIISIKVFVESIGFNVMIFIKRLSESWSSRICLKNYFSFRFQLEFILSSEKLFFGIVSKNSGRGTVIVFVELGYCKPQRRSKVTSRTPKKLPNFAVTFDRDRRNHVCRLKKYLFHFYFSRKTRKKSTYISNIWDSNFTFDRFDECSRSKFHEERERIEKEKIDYIKRSKLYNFP